MVLECINSNSVELRYLYHSRTRNEIRVLGQYHQDGSTGNYYVLKSVILDEVEGELTYSKRELVDQRRYVIYGDYVGQSVTTCGETFYWDASGFRGNYGQISLNSPRAGGYFRAKASNNVDVPGLANTSYRDCIRISEDLVNRYRQASSVYATYGASADSYGRISKPNTSWGGPCSSYGTLANSLNEIGVARVFSAVWEISIYKAGQLAETVVTTAFDQKPFEWSDKVVQTGVLYSESYDTKTFSKQAGSQGVEILPHSSKSNAKQVWLVDLDEEGNETNREMIFEFSRRPDLDSLPNHTLTCVMVAECPENTCKVDCGEHYCCYNSSGVSVESFAK